MTKFRIVPDSDAEIARQIAILGLPPMTAAAVRQKIAALRQKAETGEQWAEICRLAVVADQLEAADDNQDYPGPHSQFGVGA